MSSVSLSSADVNGEEKPTDNGLTGQNFVCLQYPGVVENIQKAFETVGGLEDLSQSHFKKRNIRLTYRPDNIYRKPVLGHKSSGFFVVIKVTRKRPKLDETSTNQPVKITCTTEVLGTVTSLYHFRGICDLQFDPMRRTPQGTYESIYDLLIPKDFATAVTWLDKDEPNESEASDMATPSTSASQHSKTPLFLPPQCFSRFHFTSQLLLCKETTYRESTKNELRKAADSVGVSLRTERKSHTILVNAIQPDYPTAPIDDAVKYADSRFPNHPAHSELPKLFEERPLWGRAAIVHHTGFNDSSLKVFLPKFAFYIKTGPFGRLWCRFGYDPRKDPTSRKYQIIQINFGKKSDPNFREFVRLRRLHQYRIRRIAQGVSSKSPAEAAQTQASDYDFRAGCIPTQRQIYYQLCDVHIPEAQQLVLDTSHKPVCHPQSGWFSAHRIDDVRQAIVKDVELTIAKLVQEKDDLNESFQDFSESENSSVADEDESSS